MWLWIDEDDYQWLQSYRAIGGFRSDSEALRHAFKLLRMIMARPETLRDVTEAVSKALS